MTTPTTNYSIAKPIVGADAGTWGTEINTALDLIDTTMFTFAPKANPTFTGTLNGSVLSFSGNATIGGNFALAGTATLSSTVIVSGLLTASGGVAGNASTATALATARTFTHSGDATGTSAAFDGSAAATLPMTLNTVNGNVGTFALATVTVNAKGLITAAAATTVATGAQVITGTNNTAPVTAQSLTSQMLLSNPGYLQHPGGLLENWGLSASVGANSSLAVTFGKAYSGSVYSIQVTPVTGGGSTGAPYAYVLSVSTSGFTIFNPSNQSLAFYWRAIGN